MDPSWNRLQTMKESVAGAGGMGNIQGSDTVVLRTLCRQ